MGLFLLRRFVNYLILLFIAVTMAYLLSATTMDPRSIYEMRNPPLDPDAIENSLLAYNLSNNVPLLERYWTWLTGVVTEWDWGRTPLGGEVNNEIGNRIWVSLRLVAIGLLFGVSIGVALGAWSAVRQYSVADRVITLLSLIAISTPTLVLAVALQVVAIDINQLLGFQLFEFIGETGERGDYPGSAIVDRLQHLLLPTVALLTLQIASYSRIQRNLMLDTLNADFVRTARAKGLPRRQALTKHALRTALIPTGTYFAFTVAGLVLGSTMIELIYNWHGMGAYGITAIQGLDIHGTVATTAFGGVCVLVGATLADLLVAALDPRVRVS